MKLSTIWNIIFYFYLKERPTCSNLIYLKNQYIYIYFFETLSWIPFQNKFGNWPKCLGSHLTPFHTILTSEELPKRYHKTIHLAGTNWWTKHFLLHPCWIHCPGLDLTLLKIAIWMSKIDKTLIFWQFWLSNVNFPEGQVHTHSRTGVKHIESVFT